ncbi:MAG TPA: cation transporter, partial [Blastocatellia bacterium]
MTDKHIDPVCGMGVAAESAAGRSEHAGREYYFCSQGCKRRFDDDPTRFLDTAPSRKSMSGVVQLTSLVAARPAQNLAAQVAIQASPVEKLEVVNLPITGMTCAACARHIEQSLSASRGVGRAGVNFATSRATVEYDPRAIGVRQLVDAVRGAGYGVAGVARAEFIVDDSARPSGSARPLEEHIQKLQGVVAASFNLSAMQVHVEYLPDKIDAGAIGRAIEEFGYRVREAPGSEGGAEDFEALAREAEYKDLTKKFWVAAILSLPVLVIAMSHGRIEALNFTHVNWVQLALTTPIVFYSGWQFYRGAWAAFRHRLADMNTLIAVGTGAAYLYSVAATAAPRFFAR